MVALACGGWGEIMPTYMDDLIELARICLRHADAVGDAKMSDALFRLALEYRRRAVELECSKIPNLGTLELPMCLHSGAPTAPFA
jgi:hypothetical protein